MLAVVGSWLSFWWARMGCRFITSASFVGAFWAGSVSVVEVEGLEGEGLEGGLVEGNEAF